MSAQRLVSLLGVAATAAGEPGKYGCGIALAGDWPWTAEQFNVDYKFDLKALVQSATAALPSGSQQLWRYDWRAEEHPFNMNGPWTYMSMDWCPQGGKGEHPNPDGPSPGLMGWNEPNAAQQCNTAPYDVNEFVALAKEFKKRGKFVVSPAPTHDQAAWLDTFLGTMHDREDPDEHFTDVDYLAYHHYVECNSGQVEGYGNTSAEDIYNQMQDILRSFTDVMYKYNGKGFDIKGLWLTEVSCGWQDGKWTGNCGDRCVRDTMDQLQKLIREHKELVTWSWFAYNNFGNLWEDDAANQYPLTEIGRWYFGNCSKPSEQERLII
mmetsp:Transcript_87294/g.154696  ORF Transcript_87294/g.154696 Transcript_87294/m.154696 type:complete len:322 (-) Transcript_87294:70-1035(-)